MTVELQETRGPRWFTLGEPYWAEYPDGPKYGDLEWDLRPVTARANFGQRRLDMSDLPLGYLRNVTDLLMVLTQPNHPNVIDAGIVRRAHPAPVGAVYEYYRTLRMMSVWGEARGLWCFAAWTQNDAEALLDAMKLGEHRPGGTGVKVHTTRRVVTLLKELYNARPILAEPIMFQPWGDRTITSICDASRPSENETAPLPWKTWAPLLTAAWAFVDRFSPDILAADKALSALPADPRGPTADGALEKLEAWFAAGGKVPRVTGIARYPGSRGDLNKRLLMRQVGIGSATFNTAASGYNSRAVALVKRMSHEPKRLQYGGLITPTVTVRQPDGTEAPWVSEVGTREALYLAVILRMSCYIVIASLTGMRDGEIQELRRGCVTTSDGLPALRSTQHKGRKGEGGEVRTWWAPAPVLRACEVMEELSPHETHLFSRSPGEVMGYQYNNDVKVLVKFVNADPQERVCRGVDLGLEPIVLHKGDSINATTLRRSFSVYSTTHPGAELGLGIQLGHSAWRMTSGYMADGKQVAVRHLDESRKELFRASAAELITGEAPLAGPASKYVEDFRAQVIADPTRAQKVTDRAAEQLHYGLTNDCLWRPESSACGADRPKLADHLCAGGDCSNALYTPAHEHVLLNAIGRFDEFLDSTAPASPALKERMGKDRAKVAKVLRELRRTATDGGDT